MRLARQTRRSPSPYLACWAASPQRCACLPGTLPGALRMPCLRVPCAPCRRELARLPARARRIPPAAVCFTAPRLSDSTPSHPPTPTPTLCAVSHGRAAGQPQEGRGRAQAAGGQCVGSRAAAGPAHAAAAGAHERRARGQPGRRGLRRKHQPRQAGEREPWPVGAGAPGAAVLVHTLQRRLTMQP